MTKHTTVLVIDDSQVIRAVVADHLRVQNIDVLTAEDAKSARIILAEHKPDCILLDYQLPETTGIEFLVELRDSTGELYLPVVMLTGEGNESLAVEAMKQGISDYLTKSNLDGEKLCSTVRNAIRNFDLSAQLRERQQELEQFAHTAAHDLKSPLTTIESFANILRDGDAGDDSEISQQQALDFIIKSVGRLRGLIDDLLDYSRVGRSAKAMVPVDLNVIVAQVVESLGESIRTQKGRVEYANLPTVLGDPTSMLQLMQNLIANALKFRGERDPIVTISARRLGEDWQVEVMDNGIGIDPSNRERVFSAFERIHGVSEFEGTGLGLSLCRKIVEQHGGSIWMDSGEDCGSVFRFTLDGSESLTPAGA